MAGRLLMAIGGFGAFACVIWWASFYSQVIQVSGSKDKLGSFFQCMFVDTVPCSVVRSIARFGGYTPYEPLFLWASGAALLAGIVVTRSSRDPSGGGAK